MPKKSTLDKNDPRRKIDDLTKDLDRQTQRAMRDVVDSLRRFDLVKKKRRRI